MCPRLRNRTSLQFLLVCLLDSLLGSSRARQGSSLASWAFMIGLNAKLSRGRSPRVYFCPKGGMSPQRISRRLTEVMALLSSVFHFGTESRFGTPRDSRSFNPIPFLVNEPDKAQDRFLCSLGKRSSSEFSGQTGACASPRGRGSHRARMRSRKRPA